MEWDASLKTTKGDKHDGRGDHTSTWDGTQHSKTVEELTTCSHDKLGALGMYVNIHVHVVYVNQPSCVVH